MSHVRRAFLLGAALCAGFGSDLANASVPTTPGTTERGPLAELQRIVTLTIEAPRLSFSNTVTTALPGVDKPLTTRRTGSFDDESLVGVGTYKIEPWVDEMSEELALAEAQVRWIGQTMWMYRPAAVQEWAGFDVVEMGRLAGGDVSGSVDGDGLLQLIVDATLGVVDVRRAADGSATWTLAVRADDLVYIVAAGGPANRIIQRGAAESGIRERLTLTQNADGLVTSVSGDLDTWWAAGVALMTGEPPGPETLHFEVTFETFDVPLSVEAPCTDPTIRVSDGMDVLICPATPTTDP